MKRLNYLILILLYTVYAVKVANDATLMTINCNPLCQECRVSNINYCTICKPGIVLYQYSCKCSEGTYRDSFNTCQNCHENCPICWGPNSDMCGISKENNGTLVNIEDEIKTYFLNTDFKPPEIDLWLAELKGILTTDPVNSLPIPINQVYMNNLNSLDLPIGSFSKYDGVFIPVPAYLDRNSTVIESHWVYKKGTWDGNQWTGYYPRLSSFIKHKGDRSKIYYENNGFWIYDDLKGWEYRQNTRTKLYPVSTVDKDLVQLNKVKLNISRYAYNKIREHLNRRKSTIQSNTYLLRRLEKFFR
jgi:hypothetical protein